MSKKLTEAQIQAEALGLGIEVAALKAVIEVECKGSGFNADGTTRLQDPVDDRWGDHI